MKFGWPISLLAHCLIAGAAFFGFSKIKKFETEEKTVRVYLASIDEITNVRASLERPKPKVEPVPEEPMTLQTPMKNAPEEGAPSERTVEAVTQPTPTPTDSEDNSDPAPADTKPQPVVTDYDSLSDLINKSRDSQSTANQQQAMVSEQNFLTYSAQAQAMVGEGMALTISESDAIKQLMREHWRKPTNYGAGELAIKVNVLLRLDGSVISATLAEPGVIARSSHPAMDRAAREAVNAVFKGAPYDFLSKNKYQLWKEMTLTFFPEDF